MFDAHCDTLLKVAENGNLYCNNYDVDFKRLSTYGNATQIFEIFNSGNLKIADIFSLIELLKSECDKSDLATFCVDGDDVAKCKTPVSALVSLEGIGNTPDFFYEHIDKLYKAGVRTLSLTWNNDNPLCGGVENNSAGLTNMGKDVLERMRTFGMVLDISHISDSGFYNAIEFDGLKIIATHSNSRTVCRHNRNITDEQFEIICAKGGVVGLNTYPLFINGTDTACVVDLIRHIEHFCSLGGEFNIGLGADFDGIEYKMKDIDSCEKMNILFDELAKMNYSEQIIRGICCENFLNFYKK
ncbi:MAG: membrane dipeptidase [Clostridia bacterium]|nr:membrane dipeptidase [Clostridia bacterium]